MMGKPVLGLRMALAFLLTPCLWYLSYLREATREPLLGGAGPVFYGFGLVWLLILTLIAWGIARWVRQPVMGPLILVFSILAGVVFGLMASETLPAHTLPWYLSMPILTHAFLFFLTTGVVFVLISGLRLWPRSSQPN